MRSNHRPKNQEAAPATIYKDFQNLMVTEPKNAVLLTLFDVEPKGLPRLKAPKNTLEYAKICLSFDSDMPQMKLTATAVEKRNPPDKPLR
jgi:hypothetical protein